MNVRLKFTKEEEVKYISHLDLMRTFHRVIRRASIPVSYSAGFNPHQEISFGAPLALGVTSQAEYVDIKLAHDMNISDLIIKLNSQMPKGIKVLKGLVLSEGTKAAMSIVTHSRYTIQMVIDNIAGEVLQKDKRIFKSSADSYYERTTEERF